MNRILQLEFISCRTCLVIACLVGFAYRYCFKNNSWGPVHVENCQTVEISRINLRAKQLKDETSQAGIMLNTTGIIVNQLENILSSSSLPIFPRDLISIATILRNILK